MNKTKGQGKISGVLVHFWLIQRQVGLGPCMVQVWTVDGGVWGGLEKVVVAAYSGGQGGG